MRCYFTNNVFSTVRRLHLGIVS